MSCFRSPKLHTRRDGIATWRNYLAIGLCGLAGIVCSQLLIGDPVRAEIRNGVQQETFKSGGARSAVLLKEAVSVLKSIDSRLQRIESRLKQIDEHNRNR